MHLSGGKSRHSKPLSPKGKPRIDEVTSSQATEQPLVFKLQLRPLEDPETFKPSVQLVSREYATRYLESVGVRPSKAAMELVHRNAPLTEGHIKTTLRAKGHVEDTIQINVPPVLHQYRPPVVISPAAVLQLGIGNGAMAAEGLAAAGAAGDTETPSAGRSSPAPGSSPGTRPARPSSRNSDVGPGGPTKAPGGAEFLDMAARYLHPFKLDLSLARQNLSSLYAAARLGPAAAEAGGGGGGSSSGGMDGASAVRASASGGGPGGGEALGTFSGSAGSVGPEGGRRSGSWPRASGGHTHGPTGPGSGRGPGGGGGGGGGAPGSGSADTVVRQEVLEELAQPLLVTPEVVLTLQAQLEAALTDWHRHQAPEALKGRLTQQEFVRTLEELSSEATIKLLITLINFLHEELVRSHPAFPANQDIRLASREGVRSSQGRGREGLQGLGLGERTPVIGSYGGGSNWSEGGGGGPVGSARSQQSSVRGSQQQLPGSISTQQMTSLQKYDLGYQAYVRQKLDQRQAQGGAGGGGSRQDQRGGGGGGGGAVDVSPPGSAAGGDRSAQPSRQQRHRQPPQPPRPLPTQGIGGGGEPQRVSFAAAPQYPSFPSCLLPDSRPGSPPGGRGGGTAASTSLFGPLSLPGPRSRPVSEQAQRPSASPAVSITASTFGGGGGGGGVESPIPGMPPRVGRALRHSPSFALASAATTARSIHASLDTDDLAALQRERLYALHVAFATRYKALRQTRSGMFFTLPILLLSMRLCVNMLFSAAYPLWSRLPEGARVLEDMDGALCSLFDPHGYLERALSVLQSTPTAIEAVTRHPQRRGNERQHFNDTSPLLQATLQGAKSAGARKLMQSAANQPQGRGLLRTQLTHEQRAALFQQGLLMMQQPDPVLAQVGEPHPPGRPTVLP